MPLLYRGKEKIHSEIELIIYQLEGYSPTSISLALLVLRPKLVLLLTDVLQSYLSASPCLRETVSFILLRYRKSRGTSYYLTAIKPKQTKTNPIFFGHNYQFWGVRKETRLEQTVHIG